MDMKKRRDLQLAYIADEAIMEEQSRCRKILQKLNFADRSDFDGIAEIRSCVQAYILEIMW